MDSYDLKFHNLLEKYENVSIFIIIIIIVPNIFSFPIGGIPIKFDHYPFQAIPTCIHKHIYIYHLVLVDFKF